MRLTSKVRFSLCGGFQSVVGVRSLSEDMEGSNDREQPIGLWKSFWCRLGAGHLVVRGHSSSWNMDDLVVTSTLVPSVSRSPYKNLVNSATVPASTVEAKKRKADLCSLGQNFTLWLCLSSKS